MESKITPAEAVFPRMLKDMGIFDEQNYSFILRAVKALQEQARNATLEVVKEKNGVIIDYIDGNHGIINSSALIALKDSKELSI